MEQKLTPFKVYLDIRIGERGGGRITFDLFRDVSPLAAENFRGLCTGEYGNSRTSNLPLSFRGCKFFRVTPGLVAQSGDFECNNGDGGESVFGGTFRDESFLRRHAQAGVLSMANRGPNSNGSQFFITLKRAPQLDGRHVAFGQVIEGMDVLRAIEKCPLAAGSGVPRVPIIIVDCGQIQRTPGSNRRNDPQAQMREAVNLLMGTLEPGVSSIEQKKATPDLLQLLEATPAPPQPGKKASAEPVVEEKEDDSEKGVEVEEEEEVESASESNEVVDERLEKLKALQLSLNQSRILNSKAASAESSSVKDRKQRFYENQNNLKDALGRLNQIMRKTKKIPEPERIQEKRETGDESSCSDEEKKWDKKRRRKLKPDRYLHETAERIQNRDELRKKKLKNELNNFGWNAINPESVLRAHEKKTEKLVLQSEAYASQMLSLGDAFYDPSSTLVSATFKPSEEAKDRLAKMIQAQEASRKSFSRRRLFLGDELDVTHVNEKNRQFNRKLEKAFGKESAEIRQNLERGTAL